MPPRPSEHDPLRQELTEALQGLREAAQDYQRRREASRTRTMWGSVLQGARRFSRLFGWTGG